jgi:hypothetical protein
VALAARILVGVIGLGVAIYAGASLSGDWLSTPPWWERRVYAPVDDEVSMPRGFYHSPTSWIEPRPGRALISVGVGAIGLAALAFAAWPRRRPSSG